MADQPLQASTVSAPLGRTTALENSRYELTLSDYYRILIKRKLVIVFSFVFVLIGSIAYTKSKIPIYAASATVKISTGPQAFQLQGNFFMPADEFSNYENMVTSDKVMEKIVIRLGLLSPDATAEDLTNKADELRGHISASQAGDTDLMTIGVTYHDPKLAAGIANEAAIAFKEVQHYEKTREKRSLRLFIEKQLESFTKKLRDTENQIQQFRSSGKAMAVAASANNRVIDLERELAAMLKKFTPKHPDVIKIQEQIEVLKKNVGNIPEDELELARLHRELEINDRAYRMMKDRYQAVRLAEAEQVSDVTIASKASIPTVPIAPNKTLNKITGAVVGILVGVVLAFVIENIDTSIGTIEDVEHIVKLPVIGVVPYYNPREEGRPWWRIDKLILEQYSKRSGSDQPADPSYLIMNQDTFSTLAEAYRILRTFIDFMIAGKKTEEGKCFLVTSTGPQEGKSLTASNLAISFAQAGKKTLLIDADLRRPSVHRLFGLKRDPGLADVLMNTISFDEARRTLGDILVGETSHWDNLLQAKLLDRLEVLTTGIPTNTPAELLTSDSMRNLVKDLRMHYDLIIIDTPPVLPVTDTRGMGGLVDAVYFVYRAGKTARRALTRAKDELALAGIKVNGIILNQATPEVTLTDKYYYQYYGETKEERDRAMQERKRMKKRD